MATEMIAERHRQIVQQDQIATFRFEIVQRMRQRELIGRDVFAEENNPAPVVLQRRFNLIEAHSDALSTMAVVTRFSNAISYQTRANVNRPGHVAFFCEADSRKKRWLEAELVVVKGFEGEATVF